jgi:hypothetical protein
MENWLKLELNVLPREEVTEKEIIPALIRALEQADLLGIDTLEIRGELTAGAIKVERRAELLGHIREVLKGYGAGPDKEIGVAEINSKLLERGVHATETQVVRHLYSLQDQALIKLENNKVLRISERI